MEYLPLSSWDNELVLQWLSQFEVEDFVVVSEMFRREKICGRHLRDLDALVLKQYLGIPTISEALDLRQKIQELVEANDRLSGRTLCGQSSLTLEEARDFFYFILPFDFYGIHEIILDMLYAEIPLWFSPELVPDNKVEWLDNPFHPVHVRKIGQGIRWITCCTEQSFSEGIHAMEIKVDKYVKCSNTWNLTIGAVPVGWRNTPTKGQLESQWAYIGDRGTLSQSADVTYGQGFTTGDVIRCELNFNLQTITFYKNGISQGTAYTTLNEPACFSISMTSPRTEMSIIGYDNDILSEREIALSTSTVGGASLEELIVEFEAGQTVTVVGLKNAAMMKYNGSRCILKKYHTSTDRWTVQFSDGVLKTLKSEYLKESEGGEQLPSDDEKPKPFGPNRKRLKAKRPSQCVTS